MEGIYKRGNKFWIRYRVNGLQIRKAVSYDKRQAEDALAAVRGDIVRGEYKLRGKPETRTFKVMAGEYLEEKADKRSLAQDKLSLNRLILEFGHLRLDQVSGREIEGFIKKRKKSVSGTTINRELALLKCFFNVAIKDGYIEKNPVNDKLVKRPKENPWRTKYVFSEDEMHKLINAAAPHLQPILWLAFGTGLRKGDILSLKWKDIDLDRGLISLVMQKTGEVVEVPLLPMLLNILWRMKREAPNSEFVFTYCSPGKEAISGSKIGSVKTAFNAAMRRAGLSDRGYRFHDAYSG